MATNITLYSNCNTLDYGCFLYLDPNLTIPVTDGWYSDGVQCYTTSGGTGEIINIAFCSSVIFPTTTTTTGDGCLIIGTKINMFDGTYKAIENIKVGDELLSIVSLQNFFDGGTFIPTVTLVTNVKRLLRDKVYIFNDGMITSTPDHIHIVEKNGKWEQLQAKDIMIGDNFISKSGITIPVTEIEIVPENVEVYNITVDNQNVYFANNILTHNKFSVCCINPDTLLCETYSLIIPNCASIGLTDCTGGC